MYANRLNRSAGIWLAGAVCLGIWASPGPALAQSMSMSNAIPVFCGTPTIRSVASGSWSNPSTWSPSRVPASADAVVVAAGTTVTYDVVSDASLDCVGVDGQLKFRTDVSTRMKVGTLMVRSGGVLEIGTEAAPVAAGVTAEVIIANRPIDLTFDPSQWGTSLLGLGKIRIHGAIKTPTFSRVTVEPKAAQSALTLQWPVTGWQTGDKLILPDTRHLRWNEVAPFVPQWEELGLAAVGGGGTQVTLTSGLRFNHNGARNGNGVLEFLPHVGNLTRNVVIRSENPAGTRGHVLFNARADVDIRYALFKDLGRTTVAVLDNTTFDSSGKVTHIGTNQIGRYSLHMHHVMGPQIAPADNYQFTLIGNAIDGSPKWGITIHDSHYGLVRDNVIYNASGAGLMAEDGSESYNVVEHNFAVRGFGTGGRQGGGREGVGFYFRGPNNYVRDNVAANFLSDDADSAYGFKYFLVYLGNVNIPNSPGADTSMAGQYTVKDGNAMALLQFAGNEAYGATESGITFWWVGAFGADFPRDNVTESVIKDFRVWHVHNKAIFQYESLRVTVDGLVVRGQDPATSACCVTGFWGADYLAKNTIIRNADIQGMGIGIELSTYTLGVQLIENSYFRNLTNIQFDTPWTAAYRSDGIFPRKTFIRNVKVDTPVGAAQPHFIWMAYSTEAVRNLIQKDEVFVYDFNQVSGDNFQVFYAEQRPNFIVPRTVANSDGSPLLLGSPVAGLTNQQNWATYGIAIAGAVAPCTTTRSGIDGLVCPLTVPWSPPIPAAPPPTQPGSLRVVGP